MPGLEVLPRTARSQESGASPADSTGSSGSAAGALARARAGGAARIQLRWEHSGPAAGMGIGELPEVQQGIGSVAYVADERAGSDGAGGAAGSMQKQGTAPSHASGSGQARPQTGDSQTAGPPGAQPATCAPAVGTVLGPALALQSAGPGPVAASPARGLGPLQAAVARSSGAESGPGSPVAAHTKSPGLFRGFGTAMGSLFGGLLGRQASAGKQGRGCDARGAHDGAQRDGVDGEPGVGGEPGTRFSRLRLQLGSAGGEQGGGDWCGGGGVGGGSGAGAEGAVLTPGAAYRSAGSDGAKDERMLPLGPGGVGSLGAARPGSARTRPGTVRGEERLRDGVEGAARGGPGIAHFDPTAEDAWPGVDEGPRSGVPDRGPPGVGMGASDDGRGGGAAPLSTAREPGRGRVGESNPARMPPGVLPDDNLAQPEGTQAMRVPLTASVQLARSAAAQRAALGRRGPARYAAGAPLMTSQALKEALSSECRGARVEELCEGMSESGCVDLSPVFPCFAADIHANRPSLTIPPSQKHRLARSPPPRSWTARRTTPRMHTTTTRRRRSAADAARPAQAQAGQGRPTARRRPTAPRAARGATPTAHAPGTAPGTRTRERASPPAATRPLRARHRAAWPQQPCLDWAAGCTCTRKPERSFKSGSGGCWDG